MKSRSQSSAVLIYFGVIATALSVLALGTTAIVKASTGMSEVSARDKTLLELQVESSREIRRALATPVSAAAAVASHHRTPGPRPSREPLLSQTRKPRK